MGGEDGGSQPSLMMVACSVLVVSVLALPDTFFAYLALNRNSSMRLPDQSKWIPGSAIANFGYRVGVYCADRSARFCNLLRSRLESRRNRGHLGYSRGDVVVVLLRPEDREVDQQNQE